MEEVINKIRNIRGVKNVKRFDNNVLEINLFSREIPDTEVKEIRGDLRKISQEIRNTLDLQKSKGVFQNWEWVVKPEKKYTETGVGEKVSDRKSRGHKPSYYRVTINK